MAPVVFEHESVLTPVTALSFVRPHAAHQTFLLAGEGPFLKVYGHGSTASSATGILLQQRIFGSQAVHGIAVEETASPRSPRVLLWGGCSVRVVEILLQFDNNQETKPTPRLEIVRLGHELNAVDWILDASFSPPTLEDSHVHAALVTAHNSLRLLRISGDNGHDNLQNQLLSTIGSDSRSILYSAHVLWVSSSGVLVAAGTVFGEILVWSCDLGNPHIPTNESKTFLHYTLTGHEGSIFGVQISPLLNLGKSHPQRILASCSDDRTIKIWDISAPSAPDTKCLVNTSVDTGFSTAGDLTTRSLTRSQNLIAVGWGHTSRVWGVRFIGYHAKQIHVLSFGEDATCRQWSLRCGGEAISKLPAVGESLNLAQTYKLHSGKHIWSLAVLAEDTSYSISTGGSDGKIASVSLPLCADGTIINQRYDMEWTLEDIKSLTRPHTLVHEASGDETPRSYPDRPRTPDRDTGAFSNGEYSKKSTESKSTRNAGIPSPDILKDYAFVSQTEFLISTTQGRVFLCSVQPPRSNTRGDVYGILKDCEAPQVRWKPLLDLDILGLYPIVTSDPASKVAFLSGSGGVVYVYDHTSGEIESLFQIDGIVSGLFPMSSPCLLRVLLTCAGSGKAYLCTLRAGRHRCRVKFEKPSEGLLTSLELPESFVVTSAGVADTQNLIFLGSRSGALAVYDASGSRNGGLVLLTCLRRVHSCDAITAVTQLPGHSGSITSTPSNYILTSGRNGTYAIHQISESSSKNQVPTITTVHISTLPFGPMIEGAYFDPFSKGLILYGFRSKSFVAWNESKECEIMNVECGGAHRNWSFSPSPTRSGGGVFVWTKSSRLHMHMQSEDSHQVVKGGSHGREIKALAISPPLTVGKGVTRQVLATGSEDTTIRIFEIDRSESDSGTTFKPLGTFRKHATGIQHLHWTDCGRYLLSSGGMEEFFIWRVRWIPGFGIGGYCESVCPVSVDLPDLRITSFAITSIKPPAKDSKQTPDVAEFVITMIYSDSTIKTYRYSSRERSFRLVLMGQYSTCCLLHTFHQHINNEMHILTAGTDGYIVLWKAPLQVFLMGHDKARNTDDVKLAKWHWRSRPHQSSTKSMITIQISPESLLIITGGDDNALVLTHIEFNIDGGNVSSTTTSITKAHASAITALTEIPSPNPQQILFASSSNDQRLKLWSVVLRGKEVLEVKKEVSIGTAVADVSGIIVSGESDMRVVVSGVGMQAWKVNDKAIIR
ncbi:MAG: hypothetical protein M1840_005934 [Geoglossum simile]|nr:MAG: hypothetical protein M1840_005934 [Geoglossum simile]